MRDVAFYAPAESAYAPQTCMCKETCMSACALISDSVRGQKDKKESVGGVSAGDTS